MRKRNPYNLSALPKYSSGKAECTWQSIGTNATVRPKGARYGRAFISTVFACAFFPFAAFSEAFMSAFLVCSTPSGDTEARIEQFKAQGWKLQEPSDTIRRIIADGFAVQNQPETNTEAAWADRRSWTERLAQSVPWDDNVLQKNGTVIRLKLQDHTGFPTCVIYGQQDEEILEFIEALADAEGLRDWKYGFYGTTYTNRKDDEGQNWRTDITIHGVRPSEILTSHPGLKTTIAATSISKQVRQTQKEGRNP